MLQERNISRPIKASGLFPTAGPALWTAGRPAADTAQIGPFVLPAALCRLLYKGRLSSRRRVLCHQGPAGWGPDGCGGPAGHPFSGGAPAPERMAGGKAQTAGEICPKERNALISPSATADILPPEEKGGRPLRPRLAALANRPGHGARSPLFCRPENSYGLCSNPIGEAMRLPGGMTARARRV